MISAIGVRALIAHRYSSSRAIEQDEYRNGALQSSAGEPKSVEQRHYGTGARLAANLAEEMLLELGDALQRCRVAHHDWNRRRTGDSALMRVTSVIVAALLAVSCRSVELPVATAPDSYVRELTPVDLTVLRAVLQPCRICPQSSGPVLVANRTLRVCEPTNMDEWCVTPFDLGLLGAKSGPSRFARVMYGRNRLSMAIPPQLATGVQVIAPERGDMPGRPLGERKRNVVYVTAPVYPSPTQAVVFTGSPNWGASWDLLKRHGEEWIITHGLGGYQY